MIRQGYIPENVTAYLKKEEEKVGDGHPHNCWGFPPNRRETPGFSKYKAAPAFVVPSDSEAFNESGKKWASECRWGSSTPKPFTSATVKNDPIKALRWVGIDTRSEGGVAYKVVTPQGWLVDLREDVVLECLFEGAIGHYGMEFDGAIGHYGMEEGWGRGTYFTGGFVWAVMGSQSRLVRVNSETHKEILESMQRKESKAIPEADLEIGGVYENKAGKKLILIDIGTDKKHRYLTQEIYPYSKVSIEGQLKDCLSTLNRKDCFPHWHFSGSFMVIRKVGQLSIPADAADRYVKKMKPLWERGERD